MNLVAIEPIELCNLLIHAQIEYLVPPYRRVFAVLFQAKSIDRELVTCEVVRGVPVIGVVIDINDDKSTFAPNLDSERSEKWLTLAIGSG
jgi:hypothetical protein